jgi:hypothetical protein
MVIRTVARRASTLASRTVRVREGLAGMLKYAECMRSHGIPNFPDPFGNSNQIGFNLTGTGITGPWPFTRMTAQSSDRRPGVYVTGLRFV